jgi:hypothetical protein
VHHLLKPEPNTVKDTNRKKYRTSDKKPPSCIREAIKNVVKPRRQTGETDNPRHLNPLLELLNGLQNSSHGIRSV